MPAFFGVDNLPADGLAALGDHYAVNYDRLHQRRRESRSRSHCPTQ